MDKVERLFREISENDDDYDRLVRQVRDILFGDKTVHVLFGSGSNGKTSLVQILKAIFEDKAFRLPYESLCSAELDSSYVPYIIDSEYILISDTNDLSMNPDIVKKLTNGYVCQYRKPYTNNWSQVTVRPKKIIIETIVNPNNTPFTNDDELNQITNIINFNTIVKNPDWGFVKEMMENHHTDVYNYLAQY